MNLPEKYFAKTLPCSEAHDSQESSGELMNGNGKVGDYNGSEDNASCKPRNSLQNQKPTNDYHNSQMAYLAYQQQHLAHSNNSHMNPGAPHFGAPQFQPNMTAPAFIPNYH